MSPYRIDVLSLVPNAFESLNKLGVIGRALTSKIAEIHIHNPRDFTEDTYKKVDDQPYGGGSGMVLKPEPIFKTFDQIPSLECRKVVMMTPQGKALKQKDLQRWSSENNQLVIICGHYEGFDERIRTLADEEISIGDYILSGGEIPALTVINGVVRLLPGTVGDSESLKNESHNDLLLEYPHYTRPFSFRGMEVPKVLRSGDHEAIFKWREKQRLIRTKTRRPDLYQDWFNKVSTNETSHKQK
tara:strand:+ start:1177 stop:1905 length:729 start_codon:yes stop_codon:yes gene_type:complete